MSAGDMDVIVPADLERPHCNNPRCSWCADRRERRKLAEAAARLAQQPTFDFWALPIGSGHMDVLGYWDNTPIEYMPKPKQQVFYLKPPHPGGPRHRKIPLAGGRRYSEWAR